MIRDSKAALSCRAGPSPEGWHYLPGVEVWDEGNRGLNGEILTRVLDSVGASTTVAIPAH